MGPPPDQCLAGWGEIYTLKPLSICFPITWQYAPLAALNKKPEDKGGQGVEVKEIRFLDINLGQKGWRMDTEGQMENIQHPPTLGACCLSRMPSFELPVLLIQWTSDEAGIATLYTPWPRPIRELNSLELQEISQTQPWNLIQSFWKRESLFHLDYELQGCRLRSANNQLSGCVERPSLTVKTMQREHSRVQRWRERDRSMVTLLEALFLIISQDSFSFKYSSDVNLSFPVLEELKGQNKELWSIQRWTSSGNLSCAGIRTQRKALVPTRFQELGMPSRTWDHGEGAAWKVLSLLGSNWNHGNNGTRAETKGEMWPLWSYCLKHRVIGNFLTFLLLPPFDASALSCPH